MIAKLSKFTARYDLGFLLVRVSLMFPILIAARALSEFEFGEYSRMFHQLLIGSSFVLFGVQDRITVEGRADFRIESAGVSLRLLVILPIVLLFQNPLLAIATLAFLVVGRVFPMLQLAATRARGAAREYLLVSVSSITSIAILCAGYILGWSIEIVTVAATIAMLPALVVGLARRTSSNNRGSFSVRGVFTGWDYFLNFLFTSLFTQGVLFITSFVTSPDQYATVSRVMYLIQAGLLIQAVAYRMVLALMVDGTIRLRQVVFAHVALGLAWLVVMAVAGGWIESLLFGSASLGSVSYVLIGLLVLLQSFNMALSPFLLAKRMVRRSLVVPLTSLCIAIGFGLVWDFLDPKYAIYAMVGSLSLSAMIIRIVLARRVKAQGNA